MGSGDSGEFLDVGYCNGKCSVGIGAYETAHRELLVTYLEV